MSKLIILITLLAVNFVNIEAHQSIYDYLTIQNKPLNDQYFIWLNTSFEDDAEYDDPVNHFFFFLNTSARAFNVSTLKVINRNGLVDVDRLSLLTASISPRSPPGIVA